MTHSVPRSRRGTRFVPGTEAENLGLIPKRTGVSVTHWCITNLVLFKPQTWRFQTTRFIVASSAVGQLGSSADLRETWLGSFIHLKPVEDDLPSPFAWD